MVNICPNEITLVGLSGAPEAFRQQLSQAMFQIDAHEFQRREECQEGYNCLELSEPVKMFGLVLPRYRVATRWEPPIEQIQAASKEFPELVFHIAWEAQCTDELGQVVVQAGRVRESIVRDSQLVRYDPLRAPYLSLLPLHTPLTPAQHGVQRVEDAIYTLEMLRRSIDDRLFTSSRFQPVRNNTQVESTRKKLDALITLMKEAAAQLDFEGVLIDWNVLPPIETETNEMEEAPSEASKLEEITDEQEESSKEIVIALGLREIAGNVVGRDIANFDDEDD
jgi:hypothetical protein